MLDDLLIVRTGPRIPKRLLVDSLCVRPAVDEFISPIWSEDLGLVLHELLLQNSRGLYHAAPLEEPVSRFEYYRSLLALSGTELQESSGRTMKAAARFGPSTGLDSAKLAQSLRKRIRQWRTALPEVELTRLSSADQRTVMAGEQEVRRVDKPWGYEIIWAHSERYVGKILFVKAGERLSLQYHEEKDETVYVLSGKMLFEVGPKDGEREDIVMKKGQSYHITPNTVHRMIAIEDTEILEASTPELNDLVRLEDSYGRAGTSAP
jgi:mannose-6-phosphate isomerase-like protein (cupin superfamily)